VAGALVFPASSCAVISMSRASTLGAVDTRINSAGEEEAFANQSHGLAYRDDLLSRDRARRRCRSVARNAMGRGGVATTVVSMAVIELMLPGASTRASLPWWWPEAVMLAAYLALAWWPPANARHSVKRASLSPCPAPHQ